jgi:hypothetical protein
LHKEECPKVEGLAKIYFSIMCKANVGPKSDHVERSDLAKRFIIAGWERERAERERERETETQTRR